MPLEMQARRRDQHIVGISTDKIAIRAIFREEAPCLADWIGIHRQVGVTKFFLYNNFSTDNFREVLAPFANDGSVICMIAQLKLDNCGLTGTASNTIGAMRIGMPSSTSTSFCFAPTAVR